MNPWISSPPWKQGPGVVRGEEAPRTVQQDEAFSGVSQSAGLPVSRGREEPVGPLAGRTVARM
ncbi:hypothetical protein [Streptomyces sp. NPDC018947]|uniref:hypothetical protein n=1 Tax=Streptomyces sp. NPDC018947 TaxID=3365054 RepID=UPI0037A52BB7